LETPPGEETRPTSDRVREALFSMLEARQVIRGARVLDLFAGSGALGLEASSRGAAEVVLVDSARRAAEVARRNVAAIGMPRVTVVLSSVLRYLQRTPDRGAGLVLLDPPYALPEPVLADHLEALCSGGWLCPAAVVVVERSSRSPEPRWPVGLGRDQVRRYGETALWTAVHAPAGSPRAAGAGDP
jgi:16S rRNA (guanine966-N2)-methyltransferase